MGDLDDDLSVLAVAGTDLRQASTAAQVEPVKQLHVIGGSLGQTTQPQMQCFTSSMMFHGQQRGSCRVKYSQSTHVQSEPLTIVRGSMGDRLI